MGIILKWRGPLKIGNLPETDATTAALRIGVVYIFFRCYEGGTTLVYVGKARNFVNRLAVHYGDFLSSKAGTLYRADGSIFRSGGLPTYFHSMQNNLDETLKVAKADASLTRFIYAPLASERLMAEVESAIMLRFERLPATFIKWNTVPGTAMDIQMQSDHSALELNSFTSEESDRLLKMILPVVTSLPEPFSRRATTVTP